MRYDILLFDADGTLLDFHKSEKNAIKICFRKYGIPDDDQTVANYSIVNDSCWKRLERGELDKETLKTRRFVEFCKKFGFENIDAVSLAADYCAELAEQSFLIEGAEDVCKELSKNCSLYIITNGFKVVQQKRFGTSPIAKYFKGCFISEEIGAEKPSVAYFDSVKSKIPNFDISRSLVIGDSLTSDIRGGVNAGIDTCWYNPKEMPIPSGASDMKITYTVRDLEEIIKIVS